MEEVSWNPWHGCTKISEGCRYCYVFRQDQMYKRPIDTNICHKTLNFDLPIRKNKKGEYKIKSGSLIMTCFSSDFLLKDADIYRKQCLEMMKERSDCLFYFFTKRIERLKPSECLDNMIVGCTCENQKMADYRLPIFLNLPLKHKSIILAPMLERINIAKYLSTIENVNVSGESGNNARILCYDWVLDIRKQCIEADVSFNFHQTGAHFVKDGREYYIKRKDQLSQAVKANIDYKSFY